MASIFFTAGNTSTAIAAETSTSPVTENVCALQSMLQELLAAKEASSTPIDAKEERERTARLNVLKETIKCMGTEILVISEKLQLLNLNANSERDRLLRDKYAGDFGAASLYLDDIESNITDDMMAENIKQLAADALSWRESFYLPLLARTNDFLLVIESEAAVRTANARYERIFLALQTVRLSELRRIKPLLEDAKSALLRAERINAAAHERIGSLESLFGSTSSTGATTTSVDINDATPTSSSTPLDSASSTMATSTPAMIAQSFEPSSATSSEPEAATPQPLVINLVKESLQEVKRAYDNYLEISKTVRSLLSV